MKTKYKIVHELKNVKLILGNGYDLQCHLKTSYADYFLYDERKNNILREWIKEFEYKSKDYLNFNSNNRREFWVNLKNFDYYNVWDVLFYIISSENSDISNWKWCDIEETIAEHLSGKDINLNCELIYKILKGEQFFNQLGTKAYVIAGFIYKKNNEKSFNNKEDFYYFLLSQLKKFESNFGKYINSQHFAYSNNNIVSSNENFKIESRKTLEELCTLENLTSIDTFNYDTPECREIESIIHNINGTITWPIFGIDSDTFPASDPRFIFTKTSRRLEYGMFHDEVEPLFDYENVIIFGCSLSKADYNYFFYVFDKLDISNIKNSSKIIFSYSVYDKSKRDIIHKKPQKKVSMLFQEYSIYKGNSIYPARLLELLLEQQKIILFEIPFDNTIESTYFNPIINDENNTTN